LLAPATFVFAVAGLGELPTDPVPGLSPSLRLVLLQLGNLMLIMLRSIFGYDNKNSGLRTSNQIPLVSDPLNKFIVLKQQTLQILLPLVLHKYRLWEARSSLAQKFSCPVSSKHCCFQTSALHKVLMIKQKLRAQQLTTSSRCITGINCRGEWTTMGIMIMYIDIEMNHDWRLCCFVSQAAIVLFCWMIMR